MAVVEFRGRVMASDLHVIAVTAPHEGQHEGQLNATSRPDGSLDDAIADVVDFLDHLEQRWSRFVSTSDVCRINRLGAAGGGRLVIDPSTLTLLESMISGYDCTAGRFDPTVLHAVLAEGYTASWTDPSHVAERPAVHQRRAAASIHEMDIDATSNTVSVPAGLAIDAGGIGKGLAADLAVARLVYTGASGALVGIGGDLALAGIAADDSGWVVDIEHPHAAGGILCRVAVSGGGVATSSTSSRQWMLDGVSRHHQIDPQTQRSSDTDLAAVTVFARCGWLAEVHATAALSIGCSGVIAYLDGHGLSGVAMPRAETGLPILATSDVAAAAPLVDLVAP